MEAKSIRDTDKFGIKKYVVVKIIPILLWLLEFCNQKAKYIFYIYSLDLFCYFYYKIVDIMTTN